MPAIERLGRYQIIDELGRGAVGTVYRAQDTVIERHVALKVVPRPGATSPPVERQAYDRFLREARAAGNLSHANIVTVFDVGEDDELGVSYLAMEILEGDTLDRVLRQGTRLSFDRIRAIGRDVLEALEVAHQAGIVHRDIKPANLILTGAGRVKVADFGIAKIVSACMTQDGTILGSPSYMSPEQIRAREIDHRSDLFSLGIVLYELVSLTPAFYGETIYEVIRQVAQAEPVPVRERREDVPDDLDRVITRALRKQPDDRFQSAAEMRAALEPAAPAVALPRGAVLVDVLPEDLPDVEPSMAATKPCEAADAPKRRSGRRWFVLAGLGVVVLLVLAISTLGPTALRRRQESRAVSPPPAATSPARAVTPEASPPIPATEPPALEPSIEPTAAPMPPPAPTRTPRRTPRPRKTSPPATPTAAPTPVATSAPTPEPTPSTRLPFEIWVEHRHRMGSCKGVLTIAERWMGYDSRGHNRDDRLWPYDQLRSFSYSTKGKGELSFEGGERDKTLVFKNKKYNFRLQGGAIPDEVLAFLRQRITD